MKALELLPLAQEAGSETGLIDWLKTLDTRALAPTLAFIVLCFSVAAVLIVKAWIKHREHLAMIEKGMHPDKTPNGPVVGEKRDDE